MLKWVKNQLVYFFLLRRLLRRGLDDIVTSLSLICSSKSTLIEANAFVISS